MGDVVEFKLTSHAIIPGRRVVEVWKGAEFLASIYAEEIGVLIVSKHVGQILGVNVYPTPPSTIQINFTCERK